MKTQQCAQRENVKVITMEEEENVKISLQVHEAET